MTQAAPRHRAGRRRHTPTLRRWPRRVLIVVNLAVALSLLSIGGVYGYVQYRIGSIRTAAAPHLTQLRPSGGKGGSPLPAQNILLIGNQSRQGLTDPAQIAQFGSPDTLSGSLSDVIMVLHLNPATGSMAILSIPRDLFVPMPPRSPVGPYQKIDAALNAGANGTDNLIQTITDDFGIPINHYVELNFNGFAHTVDALGGIKMDFPEPLYDAEAQLNVPTTGCVSLNGSQALALVRARHLQYEPPDGTRARASWPYDPESDLSRIVRDHTFLRVLASTAESQGLTNPVKANAFLGAIINQITIDPGLKTELVSLARRFRHLNPAAAPETTLPITQVGGSSGYRYGGAAIGDVDFPVQPADNQVISAWDPAALPAPVSPTAVALSDITGNYRLAARTASALTAAGLTISRSGQGTVPASTTETFVDYPPGGLPQALAVVAHLSGAVMLHASPIVPAASVTVELGSSFAVTPSGPVPTSPGAAGPTTSVAGRPTSPGTAGPSTSVPTPQGQAPSPATDVLAPWDPRPCPG
jgi:LCP family protein required for cell wall assembly